MSATAVKASRREIRRAFGDGALETLNRQGQSLAMLIDIADQHGKAYQASAALAADQALKIDALTADLHRFRTMPFWARVRWMMGR